MPIKPFAPKRQKRGRTIGMILSLVFGAIFVGSLASFITLTVQSPSDKEISFDGKNVKTIIDVENHDGFIYSTTTKDVGFCNSNLETVATVNMPEIVSAYSIDIPTITEVTSLNYGENTDSYYVTCEVVKENSTRSNYLFRFTWEDNNFKFQNDYVEIQNPITRLTEDTNNNVYAVIRNKDNTAGVYKFDSTLLSSGVQDSFLFYRLIPDNYDSNGVPTKIKYNTLQNPSIYSINVVGDKIYSVLDLAVIGIDVNDFSLARDLSLKGTTVDASTFDFEKYCFYQYTSSNNSARGAVYIDGRYFITTSTSMATFKINNLIPEIDALVGEKSLKEIILPSPTPEGRSSIFYNRNTKTAVVISKLTNDITYLDMSDLDNIKINFIDQADVNINDVIITNNGEKIIYLYKNSEKVSDSTVWLVSYKKVSDVTNKFASGVATTILLPIFIVAAVITLISMLIWLKPLFFEHFVAFLKNLKENWVAYLLLAVSLTLLGMFCYYPAVGSITMSFFRYETNQPIVWNNFNNYKTIFTNPAVWKAFGNMIIFLATDIVTAIIPPLIFAFFLTVMKHKKVSAVTRTLLFLPSVIPGLTKMMIWQNGIYGEHGVVNLIVSLFKGTPVQFFNGSPADIWYLVLMGFPYVGSYLVFYGALMNIPGSYYEAAELEGLNVWKRFFSIDIPLIRPQIKYVFILTIIASVQNFGRTYMINSSLFGVRTPIHMMYDYINQGNYGLSSAMAAILFILLFFATLFNMRKQKEQLGDSI